MTRVSCFKQFRKLYCSCLKLSLFCMYRYQTNLPTMEKSKYDSWIILKVTRHLEEDCPSTTFFIVFLANGPNKFKAQLCNC